MECGLTACDVPDDAHAAADVDGRVGVTNACDEWAQNAQRRDKSAELRYDGIVLGLDSVGLEVNINMRASINCFLQNFAL